MIWNMGGMRCVGMCSTSSMLNKAPLHTTTLSHTNTNNPSQTHILTQPTQPVATLDLTIASLLGPHAGTFDPRPHGVWVAATATGTAIPNPTPAHPTTSPSHTSVGAGTPSHARCGATTIDADARRVLYNNPLVQLAPGQTTLVQTLYQASQDGGVGGGGVGVGGGGVRGSDKGSTTTSSSTNSDARMSQSTGSPLRDNVGKHDTHHHKHDTNTTSNSTTSNPARLVQGDPQGAPQRDSMQQSGQLGRVGTDAAAAVWVASTGSVTMMQQQQQQLLHAVGQQQGVGSTMPRWKVTQERLRKLRCVWCEWGGCVDMRTFTIRHRHTARCNSSHKPSSLYKTSSLHKTSSCTQHHQSSHRGKSTKQLTQLSVQAVQTTMVNMVKHVCPPVCAVEVCYNVWWYACMVVACVCCTAMYHACIVIPVFVHAHPSHTTTHTHRPPPNPPLPLVNAPSHCMLLPSTHMHCPKK